MGKIHTFYNHKEKAFEAKGCDGNTAQILPLAVIERYVPGIVEEHDPHSVEAFCQFLDIEFQNAYAGISLNRVKAETVSTITVRVLDRTTGEIRMETRPNIFADLSLQNTFARHNQPILETLGLFGPDKEEKAAPRTAIAEPAEMPAQRGFAPPNLALTT